MAPGVAGSIPVSHPSRRFRSVAQLVEHRSPKPAVGGSIPSGPVWLIDIGWVGQEDLAPSPARGGGVNAQRSRLPMRFAMAVSSRGLGHGPLKAGTRVRIPLPLLIPARSSIGSGRHPFTVQRRVRLPYGLWSGDVTGAAHDDGRSRIRGDTRAADRNRWRQVRHASPDLCEGP